GGCAETLQIALDVSPRGIPSESRVVTIATPDGNEAMIERNVSRSTPARRCAGGEMPPETPEPATTSSRRRVVAGSALRFIGLVSRRPSGAESFDSLTPDRAR